MWVVEALGCHYPHRREVLAFAAYATSVAASMATEPFSAEESFALPDALSRNEMAESRQV